jgi:hypothetical protein
MAASDGRSLPAIARSVPRSLAEILLQLGDEENLYLLEAVCHAYK